MIVLHRNVVGRDMKAPAVQANRRLLRLSAVAKRHAPKDRAYIVSIHRSGDTPRPCDHTVRLRAQWRHTLVSRDDVVVVTYLPLGGGNSSGGSSNTTKQIGSAVALIALVAAAPHLAIGLGSTLGAGVLFGTSAASLSAIGTLVVPGVITNDWRKHHVGA